MRHVVPLLAALSFISFAAHAASPTPAVSVAYFGEMLLHPGVRAGADFTLLDSGSHRLIAAGNVGGYSHVGNSVGLLFDAEAGYRHTFSSGFFCEARVGVGYLRTFLAGDTYERGADGEFQRAPFAGQNGFAPTQAVGVGYDLSRHSGTPISVFLRLGAFEQIPFNSGWNLHPTAQLGLSWAFGQTR